MSQLLLLMVAEEADDEERVKDARRKLQDAIEEVRKRDEALKAQGEAKGGKRGFSGQKVDKYFGEKLPPVCAQLGCYVTDDGKRFYCVNPACQKHKKRDTKHTRRGRPKKGQFAYFRCPRCASRSIEMHLLRNEYACRTCKYVWKR